MPKVFSFKGETLYKWEIGPDFITIYDDISYSKPGYAANSSILDFLCTEKKLLIRQFGDNYHYQTKDGKRKRSVMSDDDLNEYRTDMRIVNSHEDNESYYHTFSCLGFFCFTPKDPHVHIMYDKAVTNAEISTVVEWMGEYLDLGPAIMAQKFSSLLEPPKVSEKTKLIANQLQPDTSGILFQIRPGIF